MKRKYLSILLVLVLVVTLAACSNSGDNNDATPPAETTTNGAEGKDTVEVGIAIYRFDDNFMTLYREELEKYFAELSAETGVTYNLDIQDGKQDQATQTEQINNFITQGKDVMILNLVDITAANAIIDLAKNADIPVVFINREPETIDMKLWPGKTTYVGADATQSGTFQGEMIADTPNQGDFNGDGKISYIMLQGDPQNVDAQQRTDFSIKALVDAGLTPDPLSEPYQANWDSAKGQEFTANALAQFGMDLEVVFSNNDGMAMGAIQSIEAAGRKVNEDIYLVGVDAIPEAVQALADGTLTGTVLNDHYNQSHTAADVAVELVNGKDVENYYWIDYVRVVDQSDAELKDAEPRTETVEEAEARYAERAK
ncbi:MAG: galactose ABC transporter substrate-binding protein [Bacillota bacterium]|nr:galactose ABC transporter substrate-binding protein [Bacillota bacterium]